MSYRFIKREFLNRPGHHQGAYIYVTVEDTTPATVRDTDVFFEITDCYKRINLDFDVSTRERENSLAKADLLVDVITQFRDALYVEAALGAARDAEKGRAKTAEAC